jgi:pSer/pThr/pTyr-binding forkhead associated (FHA) protein
MPDITYVALSLLVLVGLAGSVVVVAARRRGARRRRELLRCAQETPGLGGGSGAGGEQEPTAESPGQAELAAAAGPLQGQRFPITPRGLTLGRHPDNDVVLAEEMMVSRFHAVIVPEQGQLVLYDRDSANGTWVNEERAFRHVLAPGDRIQIWQSQFVFAPVGAPLPWLPPTPAPPPLPAARTAGDSFCGYVLESCIGRGGMSEVFRARDGSGQTVAIKILKETDPYLVAKFAQEGNQIGPLLRGHANIVQVHEFGQGPDGRLYIVMEYVDAPSLRKLIRRQWTEQEVVRVVGQVCSALAFAHENNVVHRDVKPENILLGPDGVAKVVDFGIAKLTCAATVTRDKIVGTPEYISPEQARGEPVRPASDVYSLGIVLYEMLAGSVPFRRPRGEDAYMAAIEVVRQHLKEEPEPVRKRNPEAQVSARLERVAMRALSKDLKRRYTTAREMGEDLGYRAEGPSAVSTVIPARASLVVVQGPRQGQRLPLVGEGLALGRLDLGTTDTTVSRRHATVLARGAGYWLQDTSRNGTWVDNRRVYGEAPLRQGSVIVIGDSVLRLETG